ncbi:MAG: hypothetical protein H6728_05260 [Myxococcales bacterium]|nr:hypothetical protein [Myxococcales bacterium]
MTTKILSIVSEVQRFLQGCAFNGALDPYARVLLEEIDDLLPLLERRESGRGSSSKEHEAVNTLKILFAPTGPLQEMALDHGWAEAYMKLAKKAGAWIEEARRVRV